MNYPVTYPFPLESGLIAQLIIPDGGLITQDDADRLCKMVQTLVVLMPIKETDRSTDE